MTSSDSVRRSWCLVAPLFNFSSRISYLDIADDIFVQELHQFVSVKAGETGEEEPWHEFRQVVLELLDRLAPVRTVIPSEPTHALGAWKETSSGQSPDLGDALDSFGEVVTAMRLLKPGAVYAPLVLALPEKATQTLSFETAVQMSSGAVSAVLTIRGEPYTLDEDESSHLSAIAYSLRGDGGNHRIRFAVRRFDIAYERSRADDRLVDLFIALEALYMNSSERKDISSQLSSRAAIYLETLLGNMDAVRSEVRRLYRIRSEIVHGTSPPNRLDEYAAQAEAIVRRSLRRALEDPESLERVARIALSRNGQSGTGATHDPAI